MEKVTTTKELAPIKARVTKMTTSVSGLVIKDDEGMKEAVNIRAGIKSVAKQIKEHKEARIRPLMESVALLRSDYRPFENDVEDATIILDKKMIAYNRAVQEKNDKKAEAIAEKVEEGKMSSEKASEKIENLPVVSTRAEKGSVVFKKVKDFKVVNISELPIEFHLADEVAIRKAMYAGQELAGVKYFEVDKIGGGRS